MTYPSPNFDAFAEQAGAMRAQLNEARSRLAGAEMTGVSGRVTVVVGATGDLHDIIIDADHINDVAGLRRDILAAHQDAITSVRTMGEDMLRPLQVMLGDITRGDR